MSGFPNAQNNPAGAIPVYVTSGGGGGPIPLADNSTALVGGVSTQVLEANPDRKYFLIQSTDGVPLWMNWTGADAEIGVLGNIQLAAGVTYESGGYVTTAAVAVICETDSNVTVLEG